MTYGDRLRRWHVIRVLPNLKQVVVARFVHESDADGYAQARRRLEPDSTFWVVLEPNDRKA